MSLVVPAVLPSSRKDLDEKLALFARLPSVSRVQIDVVDGKFASPASWPYTAPSDLEQMVEKGEMLPYLDRIAYEIDLMCTDAEHMAELWIALGATRLTLHAESDTDPSRLLASARNRCGASDGFASDLVSFGVALNVASDLGIVEQCIGKVEYVQFMGIAQIGRQGQPLDEGVFEKLRIFHSRHREVAIQVDGGVSITNAKKLLSLGATSLVVGSALLKARDPVAMLAEFEALQTPYGI